MACFLVPVAEAAVVTAVAHHLEHSEAKKAEKLHLSSAHSVSALADETTIPWSRKLKWLSYLLWGGALLLCFEHIWHGEVTPWFPFLTGASNPAEMLRELSTVGVTMALIVTVVWAIMLAAVNVIMKRPAATEPSAQ